MSLVNVKLNVFVMLYFSYRISIAQVIRCVWLVQTILLSYTKLFMSKVQLINQLIYKLLFTSCVFCNQICPDYLEVDTISLPSPPRLRDPVSSISSISSSSLSSFLMTTTGGGLCSERGCRWGDTIPPFPIDTRWKWYKSCHPLMLRMMSVNWILVLLCI